MPSDLHVWSVPLRTRFRGLTARDGVLVQGDAGWGEFSPFWDYDPQESLAWWRAAREAADEGSPVAEVAPDSEAAAAVAALAKSVAATRAGAIRKPLTVLS